MSFDMTFEQVLFWIGAVLIAALIAALLAKPLRRPTPIAGKDSADRMVYRDQLAELDRDAARGLVPAAEIEAARLEIQRRLLRAEAEAAAAAPKPLRWPAVLAVAFGLPLAALVLYLAIGQPSLPDAPLSVGLQAREDPDTAEFERLAAQIEARLEQNPADAQGWSLLARAHRLLGRFDRAAEDLGRVVALQGGPQAASVEVVADNAELLVFAADGTVTPAARRLFETAQAREPRSAKARYYLALASFQAGDHRAALTAWRALAADGPADATWLPMVRARIAETAAKLGEPAETGPDAAAVDAARQMSDADRETMIRGMVASLAAKMQQAPEDPQGWLRLARAYTVLGELPKARDAYAEAIRRLPEGSAERAAAESAVRALPPAAK